MSSLIAPRLQPKPAATTRAPHGSAPSVLDILRIGSRLASEFPAIDRHTIDRQVRDTWNCAAHLGADVTLGVVEELAREHLIALDGSLDLIRPARGRERQHPAARERAHHLVQRSHHDSMVEIFAVDH
ncbi:MAG: hypothetical protein JWN52_3062 [Actinomycetia bacterium]|nr:hypothetical protein [Actinomycetes bacterium]